MNFFLLEKNPTWFGLLSMVPPHVLAKGGGAALITGAFISHQRP
jgi:hypothetical protein